MVGVAASRHVINIIQFESGSRNVFNQASTYPTGYNIAFTILSLPESGFIPNPISNEDYFKVKTTPLQLLRRDSARMAIGLTEIFFSPSTSHF